MQQQICAFAAKICALCRVRLVLCGEKCLQLQKCHFPSQCLQQQRHTLPSQASPLWREVYAAAKAHFAVSSKLFAARSVCSNKGALCRLKRVLSGEKHLQQQRRILPSVSSESFAVRSICSNKGAFCRLKRAVCSQNAGNVTATGKR